MNNHKVIKKAISKELAQFLAQYFLLKKDSVTMMLNDNYIPKLDSDLGNYFDDQVPNTYSVYADHAAETLLIRLHPLMEKVLDRKLVLNYSYMRVYKKGDILHKHKDRFSCQFSTTLFIGGDQWPIFLKPDDESEPIEVNLEQGDMLIYEGCDMEHWRNSFLGNECIQVFLHYTDEKNIEAKKNIYDGRPFLGLPAWYKSKK
tara:strand:- start:2486 stop:3091 length:606 start_codon:yes stop_codon:yes gene_type:complete